VVPQRTPDYQYDSQAFLLYGTNYGTNKIVYTLNSEVTSYKFIADL